MSMIKKTAYNTEPIIEIGSHHLKKSITVSDSGVVADSEGRKWVPAGSIMDDNGAVVNDGTATGILVVGVDVTSGPVPGSVITHGPVKKSALPVTPDPLAEAPLKALGIQFW